MRTTTRRRREGGDRRVRGEGAQLMITAIVALVATFSVLVARGGILSASDSGATTWTAPADARAPDAWVRPAEIRVLPPETARFGADIDRMLFESMRMGRPPVISPPAIQTNGSVEVYLLGRPPAVQVEPPTREVGWESLRESLSPTPLRRPPLPGSDT